MLTNAESRKVLIGEDPQQSDAGPKRSVIVYSTAVMSMIGQLWLWRGISKSLRNPCGVNSYGSEEGL